MLLDGRANASAFVRCSLLSAQLCPTCPQAPDLLKLEKRGMNVNYNDQVTTYLQRLKFCSVDGEYPQNIPCALCEKNPASRVCVECSPRPPPAAYASSPLHQRPQGSAQAFFRMGRCRGCLWCGYHF
jgi:hypothetical protein